MTSLCTWQTLISMVMDKSIDDEFYPKMDVFWKFGYEAVVPRPPWCPTPSVEAYSRQSADMLRNRSTLLKLEKSTLISINLTIIVDEHAKLKTQLKTKQSSQPRAASPTCVSRVTWGPTQVSWIPDESHKRSHNDNRPKGSHVRGIPRPRDPTSIQNNRRGDQRSARI